VRGYLDGVEGTYIKTLARGTTMIDQIYFQEAHLGGIPFGEPYRYLSVEEGRRFGSNAMSLEMEHFSLMFKLSIYGGRTDSPQFVSCLIGNKDLLQLPESRNLAL